MLSPEARRELCDLLPRDQVIFEPEALLTYELDAGHQRGSPDALVLPEERTQVQSVARWAARQQIALIPRGSGTGFTAGAVATQGGVVIGFSRMKGVGAIDKEGRLVSAQCGVITAELDRQLRRLGYFYPPDPASMSVSTLGGNIANNAGGPHCFRYGVTSNYVQGLEVVLADGSCLCLGGPVVDPPEYDFVGLLTGSEGTLGMVTRAWLRFRRLPEMVKTMMATYKDVAQAGHAIAGMISSGFLPSTLELMDGTMIELVERYLNVQYAEGAGAMLIIDLEGHRESLEKQMEELEALQKAYCPLDIHISQSEAEREEIWVGRRSVGGAVDRFGPTDARLDVSVPISQLLQALQGMAAIANRHGLRIAFLGHAGDGNLHPDLFFQDSPQDAAERVEKAVDEVMHYCAKLGGSITGEHGVGFEKREYLTALYGPGELDCMQEIKDIFDPSGLLNPGKIFPTIRGETAQPPVAMLAIPPSPFLPADAPEAADGLRLFQDEGIPVYIRGGASKWRGDPDNGVLLSTQALNGVVRLSPDDLYVTALAGTRLDGLMVHLADVGYWIPLATPWPQSTLGGIVAANLNAPLRTLYGSVKDCLLAVQVALPDGRLLRFGRPLLKDVAGYAMSRLFCGSFGTLGLITELSLRIVPLPRRRASLAVNVPDIITGLEWARKLNRMESLSSGLVLYTGRATMGDESMVGMRLVFTVEGHPLDVEAELEMARRELEGSGAMGIVETETTSAASCWERVLAAGEVVVRSAVQPGKFLQMVSSLAPWPEDCPSLLDLRAGSLTLSFQDAEQALGIMDRIGTVAESMGGYVCPVAGRRSLLLNGKVWRYRSDSIDLMRALKIRWDPANILNRGEFIL